MYPEILVCVLPAVVGLCAACLGWWLRGLYVRPAPPVAIEDKSKKLSEEVLTRLYELANDMAADVGKHNTAVKEASHWLREARGEEAQVMRIVGQILDANLQLEGRLHKAESKLREQASLIESQALEARTDALTQLANRRAFDDRMRCCQAEYYHFGRPSSVLMLDVDHFKKVNDSYGHHAGDEVLRMVGRAIRGQVGSECLAARYGGEEFAVIFAGVKAGDCAAQAEKIRLAIGEATCEVDGFDLRVTASGGLAEFRPGEDTPDVLKRADEALYDAKRGGRNQAYYHDGKQKRLLNAPAASAPRRQEAAAK